MLTKNDLEYRVIHGVVPQLDFTNNRNCISLIPKTPVIFSPYARMGNVFKSANVGKIAGGIGNVFSGMLHLATGNIGIGLGKMAKGTIRAATGAVDPARITIDKGVGDYIKDAEIDAWDRYNFLKDFAPAKGKLGDEYFKDGTCDNYHSGNGYKIFDNGDYFEGRWVDGNISLGIYIWSSGEMYFGGFSDGYKNGYGLSIYENGTRYDGEYQDSMHHGVGAMWYVDGAYFGDWQNGVRQGSGICRYADGTSFLGDWIDDEPVE